MFKSVWIILLVILVALLPGCGSDSKEDETTATTELVETTEATEATQVEASTEETTEAEGYFAGDVLDRDRALDNYYYEYVMSSDGQKIGGFKLWASGQKIRFDATDEGQRLYLDYETGKGFMYIESENTLIATPLDTMSNEWESPLIFAGQIDDATLDGMNWIKKETVDGKSCHVFEVSNGGIKVTYYVWEEEGLIIKMIMETDGQPTYEYYFKDLEIDGDFEKELELPEGATVING